ncbi:hypothetical protein [Naasia lichenicola]|uniref:Uncharacterized protein n=1 Tax=Naasia lichenicola TaxID=2565933 RepID=A0A4S4FMA3_9MICO|nr:hypothetical protein [Naasia lichenicola]THG30992.1 hypothetical protein E6C64_10325 [Naasia lichenicola]
MDDSTPHPAIDSAVHPGVRRPDPGRTRTRLELQAALGLLAGVIAMATICGAIIVSGWFAGVLWDPAERFFWAGAAAGGLMVASFAAAAFPGGDDDERAIFRIRLFVRIGLLLLVVAPTLCIGAMVADFYR